MVDEISIENLFIFLSFLS